jgi:hypothetical protein
MFPIKTHQEEVMDNLVIQAYEKANSRKLYAVTRILELLLKRRYTTVDPRFNITTRQVERILRNNGLTYTI